MRSKERTKIAKTVVQSELTRDIPIIFLSEISESDQLSFSRYKSAPIDWVSRPVASHRLISKVNVFLSLQIQRLVIERLEKNLDLNQMPTRSAQDEVVAVLAGAEGCGLLRTEFVFMGRAEASNIKQQLEI